jgi:hypothetical protein
VCSLPEKLEKRKQNECALSLKNKIHCGVCRGELTRAKLWCVCCLCVCVCLFAGELAKKLIGVTGSHVILEFNTHSSGERYSVELVREPVNGLTRPG